ncbi:hypothetical protein V9T40_013592 [Parthenolecanium corni]|uniref:Integrase catalytic domain-containing protein n=1 Tax=Parthenolecanium corni TaxID=536013 RepID=A0AAN9Y1F0_9HEMI
MEEAKELHRKVVKKFQKRRIITKGIDDIWAADLLIMNQYSTRNKGYNYIFNVIDTFSKFLFAVPLKKKSGEEVAVAFSKILKTSNRCPTKLHVDRGKEFVNKEFQTVLKENKIEMYHTFNEEKSAIAERVNRTINEKLKLHFEVTQKFRWIDALEGIVKEYNENDVHRSIGTTPVSVTSKNENEVVTIAIMKKYNDIDIDIGGDNDGDNADDSDDDDDMRSFSFLSDVIVFRVVFSNTQVASDTCCLHQHDDVLHYCLTYAIRYLSPFVVLVDIIAVYDIKMSIRQFNTSAAPPVEGALVKAPSANTSLGRWSIGALLPFLPIPVKMPTQLWTVYEDSEDEFIVEDDSLQTPLATSSPCRSVRRNANGNDSGLERFFIRYDVEVDVEEEELRLMMNIDCVEPGRNHDLRGKRVWWETGDGTFELTVNSTLYVEDIEDEECEIFMRILIDESESYIVESLTEPEEEEICSRILFYNSWDDFEDVCDSFDVTHQRNKRAHRRGRPAYGETGLIRQPDGRWYELGRDGEILPTRKPSPLRFTPSMEKEDKENHVPQAPRCDNSNRRPLATLSSVDSTPQRGSLFAGYINNNTAGPLTSAALFAGYNNTAAGPSSGAPSTRTLGFFRPNVPYESDDDDENDTTPTLDECVFCDPPQDHRCSALCQARIANHLAEYLENEIAKRIALLANECDTSSYMATPTPVNTPEAEYNPLPWYLHGSQLDFEAASMVVNAGSPHMSDVEYSVVYSSDEEVEEVEDSFELELPQSDSGYFSAPDDS